MSKWKNIKLGDVVIFNPDSIKKEYPYKVIEYLDISSVGSNISYGTQTYTREAAPGRAKRLVRDGDTIFSTVRPNLKTYLKISNPCDNLVVSTGFAVLRPTEDIDDKFLFYSLTNQSTIDEISAIADSKTTSYPAVTADDIAGIEIYMPKKKIQIKIGNILSNYDNLIENNNRRIAILEEMAMRIYREWFVHFRFPGYENVKMVESELGLIPEGWMISTPKNVVDYYIGGGWGKDTQSDSTFPAYVIRGTDIPQARINNVSECPLRYHKKSNLNSRILTSGDIVIEVSGGSKGQAVGRSLLITHKLLENFDVPTICASFCKLFRCNSKISSYYFYMYLKEIYNNGEIEKYQLQSTGIINFKFEYFLENAMFIFPPQKVQDKFEKIVRPLFEEINLFGAKNTILRKTRDHLLPYLISGDIDVSKLPIHIKED